MTKFLAAFLIVSWAFIPVSDVFEFQIGDRQISLQPNIHPVYALTQEFAAAGTSTFVVPSGVTSITVKAWGGGGGSAGSGFGAGSNGGAGGGGGYVTGRVSVSPGETLTVVVGGAGGAGLNNGSCDSGSGGGGGGYSAVTRAPNGRVDNTYLFIAAGGGGGAGGGDSTSGTEDGGSGGAGGNGTAGTDGMTATGAGGDGGGGGTQSGGGTAGAGGTGGGANGVAGTSLNAGIGGNAGATSGCAGGAGGTYGGGAGGTSNTASDSGGGGGGGGGYFGGGGGEGGIDNSAGEGGGGGGGGSSFATTTATSTSSVKGNGVAPGNATDPHYSGTVGVGAATTTVEATSGADGNAGRVIFITSVTISGTLYSGEGVGAIASKTVKLVVGTSTPGVFPVTTNGSGAWSVPNIPGLDNIGTGTPMAAFVDGDATTRAFTFTKATSSESNITGLDLYQNRVIVRHGGTTGTSTTIADLSFYDADDDSDIQFTANSGALVTKKDQGLYVWPGTHFAPGGTVTLHGNASTSPEGDIRLATGNGTTSIMTLPASPPISSVFSSAGTTTYTVPLDVTSITVKAWGAGAGGGGGTDPGAGGAGGAGGFAQATISVTPGESLTVVVGNNGSGGAGGAGGAGGGGGGYSSVNRSATLLVQAGGGGAGGAGGSDGATPSTGGAGGAGGGSSGSAGSSGAATIGTPGGGGGGGTQSAGGAGGTPGSGADGSANNGGAGAGGGGAGGAGGANGGAKGGPPGGGTGGGGGGGGGGGQFGGGGGGAGAGAGGGGAGGGSSLVTGGGTIQTAGSGTTPGNNTDSDYAGSAGVGGAGGPSGNGAGTAGNPGSVVIIPDVPVLRLAGSLMASSTSIFNANGATTTFSATTTGKFIYATSSSLGNIDFNGSGGGWTFGGNATTTNFFITNGTVTSAPLLTVQGHYSNSGTFTHNSGTTTFSTTSPQTLSGTMTGSSAFNHVEFTGSGTTTFAANASTTDFVIANGTTTAPSLLSISGNYTNNGIFTAGSGTTTLNGTSAQVATGTMTGSSAFANLDIKNNSATTTFGAAASTTANFYAVTPGSRIAFKAAATSTLQNLIVAGTTGNEVYLHSATPGSQWNVSVPGVRSVSFANIKDSHACTSAGDISTSNSIDGGNNTCWTIVGANPTVASESNQTFAVSQGTTAISPITVTEHVTTPSITLDNDLRIAIATSSVRMLWDTTDTTASFSGTAQAKVSNPIAYEGDGSVLRITVDSNFSAGQTLIISGLSFKNFTAANGPAAGLKVFTGGYSDQTADATDDKTVAIKGGLSLSAPSAGQEGNKLSIGSATSVSNAELLSFRLATSSEDSTVSSLVVSLTDVQGFSQSDITSPQLYIDYAGDGAIDGADVQVGGNGSVSSIANGSGTITFSSSFTATTSDYILRASVAGIAPGDALTSKLLPSNVTASGKTSLASITLSGVTVEGGRHTKPPGGGGTVGDAAPSGAGIVPGGTQSGGSEQGSEAAPPPSCTVCTTTVYSTAGTDTYVVPSNVTGIRVKVWGAGGGKGFSGGNGGGAGFAQATISVTPGETLDILVGGGGGAGTETTPGAAGTNGGAAGGDALDDAGGAGGAGGGGYSAVKRSSTFLVQAGGGGGGANGVSSVGGVGGGASGGAGGASTGGGGGTTSAGGSAGAAGSGDVPLPGSAGSANQGGAGGNGDNSNGRGGGGGGGGRFGGGGGGSSDTTAGGGGGGSSLVTGSGTVETAGSGTTPGNNTDGNYASPAGVGASSGAGNPGRAVITVTAEIQTGGGSGGGGEVRVPSKNLFAAAHEALEHVADVLSFFLARR